MTEARKLGLPVVAVVDTNCDPDVIDYVIPGNDDAIRSGTLMCRVIADAVVEGRFIAAHRRRTAPAATGRGRRRLAVAAPTATPTRGSRPSRWRWPDVAGYTAKDVAALRQMTGAGMLDARTRSRRPAGTWTRPPRACATRAWPAPPSGATARPSEGAVAVVRSGDAAAVVELRCETDFVAKAEDFVALVDELAALVAAKGEEAVERAQPTRSTACAPPSRRTSRSVGCARLVAGRGPGGRHLPPPAGGPGRQRRGRGARGGLRGAGPRHRRAHRLRQAGLPEPRRGARGRGGRRARHARDDLAQRGEARGGAGEDRRGPPQRAGSRSACCSTRPTCATRSRRSPRCWAPRGSCRSPRSSSATERRSRGRAAPHRPQDVGGGAGLRRVGRDHRRRHRRAPGPGDGLGHAGRRRSSSGSWSAAATSGGARRGRAAAWTGPPRTPWACWAR